MPLVLLLTKPLPWDVVPSPNGVRLNKALGTGKPLPTSLTLVLRQRLAKEDLGKVDVFHAVQVVICLELEQVGHVGLKGLECLPHDRAAEKGVGDLAQVLWIVHVYLGEKLFVLVWGCPQGLREAALSSTK